LVLGGGSHMAVYCQVRQELTNLLSPHVFWMTFILKQDESPDPENISLFGPEAVVFDANSKAHLVEQFRFLAAWVCVVDAGDYLTSGAKTIDAEARC
jgi:hypothetical protein